MLRHRSATSAAVQALRLPRIPRYPGTGFRSSASRPATLVDRHHSRQILHPSRHSIFGFRNDFSTSTRRMETLKEERWLQHVMEKDKLDKWGWVIYRCTYKDDEAWPQFKAEIEDQCRESLRNQDVPELIDTMEWTFVEDRESLDGASKDQLRARFKAWAEEAIKVEQPRATDLNLTSIPRYAFFIQIDEEALYSITAENKGAGFVNFVDAHWQPLVDYGFDEDEESDYDTLEAIDGCKEENVGWMMIHVSMVDAYFYSEAPFDDVWYVHYLRPPNIVLW